MTSFTPYNISLNSSSPTFIYQPYRDGYWGAQGDPAGGWRGSFTGVTSWPGAGINNLGSGSPFRETYMDGSTVTLDFEGTGVYLCFTPTASSFTFTVDDDPVSTTGPSSDPACAARGGQVMAYAAGLTYGGHTATLRVNAQGSTDFQFFGGVVTVGLNGTNPILQYVDDTDPGWTYELNNTWTTSTPANDGGIDYNDTLHWMCSYGPSYTASYTFNGSSAVQLLGLLDLNIGAYTIQLDGQSYIFNGSDLWRESQQVLFFQGGLVPTRQYTLTLVNYDSSAPDAQQPVGPDYYPCASIDALILTKTTPLPPLASSTDGVPSSSGFGSTLPSTSASSNNSSAGTSTGVSSVPTGAIIGAIVGAIAAIIIALLLWALFQRRRRSASRRSGSFAVDPAPQAMTSEITPYLISQPHNSFSHIEPEGYTNVRGAVRSPITLSSPAGTQPRQQKTRRDALSNTPALRTPSAPPAPAGSSDASVPTPLETRATPSNPPVSGDLNAASTEQLVSILNLRLRQEYRSENSDIEPPHYDPDA